MHMSEYLFHHNHLYLYKPIPKIHTISKIIRPSQVTIEGKGVKLCHNKYLIETAVDTITHRDVDQPVIASNGNLKIKPN